MAEDGEVREDEGVGEGDVGVEVGDYPVGAVVERHERKDLGLHEGGRLGRVVRQRDEAAGRRDELGEGDEREETAQGKQEVKGHGDCDDDGGGDGGGLDGRTLYIIHSGVSREFPKTLKQYHGHGAYSA